MSNDDQNQQLLNIDSQQRALGDLKAAFYLNTVTPDHTTKVFSRDVVVELDDIMLLNERISEKLRTYENQGFVIKVNIKYENKKEIQFSTWDDFKKYKDFEDKPITNIVLLWEFNAVLPQYSLPQKHSLMVKISNGMTPEEMLNIIFSGEIENFSGFDKNFFPIIARVDFIDRLLGDELLEIVKKWNNGLKDSGINRSKFLLICKRFKQKIALTLDFGTYFLSLLVTFFIINGFWDTLSYSTAREMPLNDLRSLGNLIILFFFVAFGGKRITNRIGNFVFKTLRDYGDGYIFLISRGDKRRRDKMQNQEKFDRIKLVSTFGGTLLFNLALVLLEHLLF